MYESTYQTQILDWKQEYVKSQNKGCSYIPNPFKHILWDLKSQKDKNKEEANSSLGDDFKKQLLFGYDDQTEGGSSTS